MFEFVPIIESLPLLWNGLQITLIACSLGSLLAIALGVVFGTAYLLRNPVISLVVRSYVYFFRGTPQLVLLFLAYFGLPVIGIELPALAAGIIAMGLCSGAYITEAVRSALEGIDRSQQEAASLEGAAQWQILVFVAFPQALRQIIAPTTNELINLVKGSSLLAVISVGDVTRAAQLVVGREFIPFEMYLTLACIYLVINSVLTRLSHLLERWTEV
jgi:His/Glu/Gln/Arg/opine family amino acid ABC transporter permease subunit